MAIIDDYAAIAASRARLRGEVFSENDQQRAPPPRAGRDSLLLENGRVRLFPRRTTAQIRPSVMR